MARTVESYKQMLRDKPTKELTVSSLTEYVNLIIAIDVFYKNVIYRGQADISWEIESSAYRKLTDWSDHKKPKYPTQKILQDYHIELVSSVKKLNDSNEIEKYDDIKLLSHLQHNGAKTGLFDYTQNPLVALWFACISKDDIEKEKDGVVYFFSVYDEGTKKVNDCSVDSLFESPQTVTIYEPPKINRRITSQQSVLIFRPSGKMEKYKHKIISIKSESKQVILEQLEMMGICNRTLFPDFHGFVEWFEYSSKDRYNELMNKYNIAMSEYKLSEAQQILEDLLEVGKDIFNSDDIEYAKIYILIAEVYYYQRNYATSMNWYKKALAIRESVSGKENPDAAEIYNDIALVYDKQGKYDTALYWYSRSLEISKKFLGKQHSDTATIYDNIALVYNSQGDYKTALKLSKKALFIKEKVLGEEHADTSITYNNIAGIYDTQGKYELAINWYKKALDIRERVLGKEHPTTAFIYNNIASAYYSHGNYDSALKYYLSAYKVFIQKLGEQHEYTTNTKNGLKKIYKKLAIGQDYEEWLREALK